MKKNIWDSIKSLNRAYRVKVCRTLSRSTGKYILYLEHTHNGVRDRFYPGMSLFMDADHRGQDELTVRRILLLREEKEKVIQSGGSIMADSHPLRFYDYAVSTVAAKKPKNRSGYLNAINSFDRLFPGVMISEVTSRHALQFGSSISALTPCTVNHYYVALRHIFSHAIRDGMIESNPFAGMSVKRVSGRKEFLSIDEIQSLMSVECSNADVKRAFLFSCFTGLRLGDVGKLDSDQVRDGFLYYTQSKTGAQERLRLPALALELISGVTGRLFVLPAYKQLRRCLASWVRGAGITKRITYHCSRHTFATLQLTLGTDIFTVSKLLGHSDVRVTQVYAKLVDAKKDEAMGRIDMAGIGEKK